MNLRGLAAGAMAAGFATNVAAAALGLPTICMWLREVTHVETPVGRLVVIAGSTVVYVAWLKHILATKKRPVRVLALAQYIDDARMEF